MDQFPRTSRSPLSTRPPQRPLLTLAPQLSPQHQLQSKVTSRRVSCSESRFFFFLESSRKGHLFSDATSFVSIRSRADAPSFLDCTDSAPTPAATPSPTVDYAALAAASSSSQAAADAYAASTSADAAYAASTSADAVYAASTSAAAAAQLFGGSFFDARPF